MLWWLAQNTILAALLAGVVSVICRLVRPRPAVRHALWLIVLIKLVTPPLVHWPWPPPDVWRHFQPETCAAAAKSSDAGLPTRELTEWPSPDEVSLADEAPVDQEMFPEGLAREEAGEPTLVRQPSEPGRAPLQLLVDANPDLTIPSTPLTTAPGWLDRLAVLAFWSWLTGAVVMAIVQLIQILRFRRLRARGTPAPQWLWSQVEELAQKLGVRPPSVLVLPGIGSPMLCSA